jgi:outer membrane protein TolC
MCAVLVPLTLPAAAWAQDDAPKQPEPSPEPAPDAPGPKPGEDDLGDVVTEGGELTNDYLAEALSPSKGGLTPKRVAKRAVQVDPSVRVKRADLRAAAARVDRAYAAYFPTLTFGASYTRVSPVENSLDFGIDVPGVDTSFEVINNYYSLTASLDVPLSDYILRLTQAFAAVSLDVEARDLEVKAEQLQARAEAKLAYFSWVRARGQAAVTKLSVELAERNLRDANLLASVGLAARADVKRLEAQLVTARYLHDSAQRFEQVAAEQLRTILHWPAEKSLVIGIDVLADPKPIKSSLPRLQRRALRNRLEKQALEKSINSLEEIESATRAGYYPRLSAFANALYANPNPRIFPQQEKWDFTWEVGARLTWVVNETFTTIAAVEEVSAQRAAAEAQLTALEDAIRVSVASAYYDLQNAENAIANAKEGEAAATVVLEDRRKLYRAGNATTTDIVDAERALTLARLQRVDAHLDWFVAKTRLELAVGGTVK